jgi:LPS O-antigen subunit length determinant protein (WzzB/FepE family)
LFQAAGDAAETRKRIEVREERIQDLANSASTNWHWNHTEHELEFAVYFNKNDATQLQAVELTLADGEVPTPYERIRFEEELEFEIATAHDVLDRIVSRTSDATWPRPR